MGVQTWAQNFVNMLLRNFGTGFHDRGLSINYHGPWVDVAFEGVLTPFQNDTAEGRMYINDQGLDPTLHPAYGVMGPWTIVSTDAAGYTAIPRTWVALNSALDLPTNLPAPSLGLGGVEPSPGTPKPYFVLDAGSDTTTGPADINSVSLSGVIVDNVGVRKWPDGYTENIVKTYSASQTLGPRKNDSMTGEEMVLRNGCFTPDAGVTWFSRLWFIDHERLTGDYFLFSVDITLTGFDPAFLNANVVDPNAIRPALPLVLEAIGSLPSPIEPDLTPPAITMPTDHRVAEGDTISILLQADDGHVKWSIAGGEDAADFVISGHYLQWAGNVAPAYVSTNATRSVILRATDPQGNFSDKTINVVQERLAMHGLVPNGQFNSSISGWGAVDGAILSWVNGGVNGRIRVEYSAATVDRPIAQIEIATVVGQVYTVSCKVWTNTTKATLKVLNGATAPLMTSDFNQVGTTLTFTFTAEGPTSTVQLRTNNGTAGKFAEFDDVLVQ